MSSLLGRRDDDRRFSFRGFDANRVPAPRIDSLTDDELQELNGMLDWSCFTADGNGRRFGRRAWAGKRETPQPIPDPRIVLLNEKLPLAGRHVLEVGCFEGVHTIGLSKYAKTVTAVDARMGNVVKTMVRCGFFGCHANIFKCDLEKPEDVAKLPLADVLHHVGVFYHLVDPVRHLRTFDRLASAGVMLDTHYATIDQARNSYTVDGREFRYFHVSEGGRGEVFSGMGSHAKWLTLEDIVDLLGEAGFPHTDIVEKRDERNGSRVLLIARRAGVS